MQATQSILNFSVSLGPFRGVRVRVSLLMFVAMLAIVWRLGELPLGLLACTVLLMSVLVHQLAQFFVARATGYKLADIVLWPLGGLTTQAEDAPFPTQAQVQLAGPVANFALAAICFFQLQHLGSDLSSLNPLQGFHGLAEGSLTVITCRMTCFFNVLLLFANLLPVAPFDTGRLLRSFLSERYDRVEVTDVMLRLGLVISVLGLATGFVFDQSTAVALSSFVLILHLHELGLRSAQHGYFRTRIEDDGAGEFSDMDPELDEFESFRGPAEDTDTDELIARSSMMARRTARRESEERRREAARRQNEEEQVDAILERIHREGEQSLDPTELQLLRKVSQRYRKQSGTHERNTETGR